MASAYIKNMGEVAELMSGGNMEGALAKWKE